MKYCIACQRKTDIVFERLDGIEFHIINIDADEIEPGRIVYHSATCYGPIVACPPPDDLQGNDGYISPAVDECFINLLDYDLQADEIIMLEVL